MLLFMIAGIDAVILSALVAVVNVDEIDMSTAFIVALVSAVGTGIISFVLFLVLGLVGFLAGLVVATVAVGFVINAIFDIPGKRAFLIAALFMIAHGAMTVGLNVFTSSPSDPATRRVPKAFNQKTEFID